MKKVISKTINWLTATRRRHILSIVLAILVSLTSIRYIFFISSAKAAWFDDAFAYRKKGTFTHSAAIGSERRISVTVDTATLISAGKMQSDCDDTRFTDVNGLVLYFQLTGTCDHAATTFDVVFPTIVNGTNDFYLYYSSPLAPSGSRDVSGVTSLSPSGGAPSLGSEEKGPGPILYWKFNEGYGTTAYNATLQPNDGTLTSAGTSITKAEQQINFIDQDYTTTNTTDSPTDNSLGLILWDGTKYTGETVYFEAVLRCTTCTGGNTAAVATVYTDTGSSVSGSSVSTTSTSYTLVRSSAITANLTNNEEYSVRIKVDATSGTADIKAARLIVSQSDATAIIDTQNQIEMGNNQEITATTYGELTHPKYYYYDTNQFSGSETAYFEATLQGASGASTQGNGRIWSSGFELGDILTADMEWTARSGNAPSLSTSTVRSGSYALRTSSLSSGFEQATRYHFISTAANGPFYFRTYVQIATLPSAENRIMGLNDNQNFNGTDVYLTLDNSGDLRLYDEDGQIGIESSALSTGAWYRIEIEYDRSGAGGSHVVRARIDGSEFAGSSTRNISVGVASYVLGGNLNDEAQTTGEWFYDDVAINDSTGGYPGSGNIIHLKPNNTGDNDDWTNDYTAIDEVTPNNATDYIVSTTLNQIEDVNLEDTSGSFDSSDVVNNVSIGVRAVSDLSGGNARFVLRVKSSSGGTVEESGTLNNNTTTWYTNSINAPKNYALTLYDLPGASTTDWTKSDLDSAQIGAKLTVSDGAQEARISTLWMLVDYTPVGDLGIEARAKLQQCDEAACSWSDVSGSTVANATDSYSRVRSSAITLTSGRRYRVAVSKSAPSGTIQIANAKLIIDQTDAEGLINMELIHQHANTLATHDSATYTSQNFINTFEPSNFSPAPTVFYEATIKTSAGTGYAQIFNNSAGSAVSGSEISSESTSYTRVRSSGLTMPDSTANLDTQLKNSASNTTSVATTWLIHRLSGSTSGTLPTWKNQDLCLKDNCLYFAGDLVKKTYASDAQLDPGTDGLTVSAWFKHPSDLSGTDTLVSRYAGGGYRIYTSSSGFCFGIDNDGTSFPSDAACTTTTYADSNWHFVTAVKNGTANIRLYIDGSLAAEDASITSSSVSGSSPDFIVGTQSSSGTNPWDGFIDDVKVYNFALTEAQIKANYIGPGSPKGVTAAFEDSNQFLTQGLLGYWQLDDSTDELTDQTDPGTAVNNAGYGSISWSTPANITASNNMYAQATLNGDTNNTNYLEATNFGFSIPANATIWGIQLRIERKRTGGTTGEARDNVVRLVKGGSVIGDNKARTDNWPVSDGTMPYGNSTDVWGTTWTPADINASNFGVVLAATGTTASTDRIANVDNLKVTVYYSENNHAADSSGSGITLTNNAITQFKLGKFGRAPDFVPASSQYFSTATAVNGIRTVSFWTYPDSTTNYFLSLASGAYIISTSGSLSAPGFNHSKIYVDGVETTTIANNTWQLVTVTTDTAINADQIYLGRQGTNYMDGILDEVRFYNRELTPSEIQKLSRWAPEPILYLSFDEGAGTTTVNDLSGNGLFGTLNGSITNEAWVPGKMGSALEFDGSDDYLEVTDHPALDIGKDTSLTASVWVKFTSGADRKILHKGMEESGEYDGSWILDYNQANTRLHMTLTRDTWNFYCSIAGTTDVADGNWHHISAVVKRTTGCTTDDIFIYVDGVKETTSVILSAINSDSNITSNDPLTIGAYNRTGSRLDNFNGSLDELKIYNYARTPEQIVQDMNAGHPVPGSPVGSSLLHYKFDEGYGDTANDSGTGGNSGDLAGSGTTCPQSGDSACPIWTNAGKFGKALAFDPAGTTDDYVDSGDITDMDELSAISFGGWVNPDSYAPGTAITDLRSIMVKGDISGQTTDTLFLYFSGDGAGSHRLRCGVSNGTTLDSISLSSLTNHVPLNQWRHVLCTWSSAGEIIIYINGNKVASQSAGSGATINVSFPLRIGSSSYSSEDYFDGTIDEVKVYNFALSGDQVAAEYNRGSGVVWGVTGTESDDAPSSSTSREYCVPGDVSSCNPPVAELNLDENSGTSAYDTSENNYTGNLTNNPDWVPGKYSSGIFFNGQNNYLSLSDNLDPDDGNWTYNFWIKTSQASRFDFDKRVGSSTEDEYGVILSFNQSAEDSHQFRIGNEIHNYSFNLNDDQWHHLTLIRDWANSELISYVDGVLTGNPSSVTVGNIQNNADFNFAKSFAGDYYFNGYLDQIRVYNYARTPAQVAWDYTRGAPIGWWKFDECQGITANDASGRGQTGTITEGGSGSNVGVGSCGGAAGTMWADGATGKRNSALEFDGTDDYVILGDVFDVTGSLTLMGWAYSTATDDENSIINKNGAPGSRDWALAGEFTNWLFRVSGDGATVADRYASVTVQLNSWVHVAGVYDATAQTMDIYINGQLRNGVQSNPIPASLNTTNNQVRIGSRQSTNQFFNGKLDDVRVYNYPLTTQQIRDDYNSGALYYGPATGIP